MKGSKQGAKGSKESEGISMLGFRVPTTCGGKGKEGSRGSKGGAKGVKGAKGGRTGGISILGF